MNPEDTFQNESCSYCCCEPAIDAAPVAEEPIVPDPAPVIEEPAPVAEAPAPVFEEPAPAVEAPAPPEPNFDVSQTAPTPEPTAEVAPAPAPAPIETYSPAPAEAFPTTPAIDTAPMAQIPDATSPQPLIIQSAPIEAPGLAAPAPSGPVDLADLLAPGEQTPGGPMPLVITSDQAMTPAPLSVGDLPGVFRTNPDGSQSLAVQPVAPMYDPLGVPAPGRSGAYTWSLGEGWHYGYAR
jgi:hypothetical protein